MAELIWSEKSLSDLEEVYDYIANDSQNYARQQMERIWQSAQRLCQFPESGHRLPEYPQLPHRELVVGNYRVIYRHDSQKDEVIVVTVTHGARRLGRPGK